MTAVPRDLYAVLGNPVEHSLSPVIHAAFAQQTGQAVDYIRVHCPLDGFAATLREFAARPRARGCNVTVPFKFEVPALAARLSARAALAGAANTLRFDADGWYADNTDGIGLVRDLELHAGQALAGQRVLLVGAGGAGAGVLGPLLECRPAELVIANRTLERARALAARHAELARAQGVALHARGLGDAGTAFDLVVNASASSLHGGDPPVDAAVLRPGTLAVDLMYGRAAAGFMAWAQAHGARARDGLGMLVEQAAEAFHLWRGLRPDGAAVLAMLRERAPR